MSGAGAVLCRADGLHVAESARLWIVVGRYSDMARWCEIASEPGAQRWLGWRAEDLSHGTLGALADPLESAQPVLPVNPKFLFFAGIERRTRRLVAGLSIDRADGKYQIGGVVHAEHRRQGYGRETLQAVCALAHRHFGIDRLTAGCPTEHVACRRWLAGAGFTQVDGPAEHTLPDGRPIPSVWWERRDRAARLACRRLRPRRPLFGRRRPVTLDT